MKPFCNCNTPGHSMRCPQYPYPAPPSFVEPTPRERSEGEQDREVPHQSCNRCGGPYRFDLSVPSETWNPVIRPNGEVPDLLCAYCIIEAFAKAGASFEASLWGNGLNGERIVVSVDPPENNDKKAHHGCSPGHITERKRLKSLLLIDSVLARVACPHERPTGGNDYIYCETCGHEWDYRQQTAQQAIVSPLRSILVEAEAQLATVRAETLREAAAALSLHDGAMLPAAWVLEWLRDRAARLSTLEQEPRNE